MTRNILCKTQYFNNGKFFCSYGRTFTIVLLFLCIISLFPLVEANSEAPTVQWQQVFEGSRGCSILQTENGGYVFTGAKISASLLMRTDSLGNLLWTKSYWIGGEDTLLPFLVQTEDGYALAGTSKNSYAIVRVDSEGSVIWEKKYEHDGVFNYPRSFIQTSDGGYALVGTYLNQPPSDGQTWFVKVDNMGNVQWNKTIGEVGDFVASVLQTEDGGYALICTSWASEIDPAIPKIIKINSKGTIQWNETYGGVGKSEFYYTESFSGTITEDAGYLIGGFAGQNSTSWIAWLLKTNSQGKMLWNVTYGEFGSLANSVLNTQDGGYAFAGVVNRKDAWVVKTDEYGIMDWNLTFSGSSVEAFCNSILQTSDEGYTLVGTKDGKIWLAKLGLPQSFSGIPHLIMFVIVAIIAAIILIGIILRRISKENRARHLLSDRLSLSMASIASSMRAEIRSFRENLNP